MYELADERASEIMVIRDICNKMTEILKNPLLNAAPSYAINAEDSEEDNYSEYSAVETEIQKQKATSQKKKKKATTAMQNTEGSE